MVMTYRAQDTIAVHFTNMLLNIMAGLVQRDTGYAIKITARLHCLFSLATPVAFVGFVPVQCVVSV